MKNIVIIYGVTAGLILSLMVFVIMEISQLKSIDGTGKWIGNVFMITAFSFIYLGIKNFRDKHSGGIINFNRAFRIGLLITLLASVCYSVTWLVYYNFIDSSYIDNSTETFIKQLQSGDIPAVEIENDIKAYRENMDNYKKPGVMAFYTFMEMFPVGLVISILCGFLMRRKAR